MHPDTDWLDTPTDDTNPPPPPSAEQAAHAKRLRERRAALEERRLAAALEGMALEPGWQDHAPLAVADAG